MDYKDKYTKALNEAITAHKDEDKHLRATLERIFPELKESKDQRIRKALIKYFNAYASHSQLRDGVTAGDAIAWLEKQVSPEDKGEISDGYHADTLLKSAIKKFNSVQDALFEQKPIERKDYISIPFGAFDSELYESMITIPDGCVATIEGRKVFIRKKIKN